MCALPAAAEQADDGASEAELEEEVQRLRAEVERLRELLEAALPAFEGASIPMNALLISRVFVPARQLIAHVRKHYQKQYFKNLSPLDALASSASKGNTAGFFGGAVTDIFYEPAQVCLKCILVGTWR